MSPPFSLKSYVSCQGKSKLTFVVLDKNKTPYKNIIHGAVNVFFQEFKNNLLAVEQKAIYDFKMKGRDVLRGRYGAPTLCELTLKWSNFFPIGGISGLEKYVMFQHQVCLFSRNVFEFVYFPRFLAKTWKFWAIFNLNGLSQWETNKVKNF